MFLLLLHSELHFIEKKKIVPQVARKTFLTSGRELWIGITRITRIKKRKRNFT